MRLRKSGSKSKSGTWKQIASLNMRTIEALALAIEAKDHTTHTHLQRVRTYAVDMAKN